MTTLTLPADILQRLRAKAGGSARVGDQLHSLEWMLTSERAFGLTSATPVQRAICRILDGTPLGELEHDPDVVAVLGGPDAIAWLRENPHQALELCVVAGIRGGKSLIAAAMAVRASQTCDVSKLGPGEVPRVSVVSLKMDIASVSFGHLLGRIQSAPALRDLLIGKPTADTLMLRHPSGRPVEVKVVAGSRAGGSLVARWSAGVIFDEATRMIGAEEGVVNLDDARRAVLGRLLPGAQAIYIGSAFAPFGPVYDMVKECWGKPKRDMVVVRAKAWQMNPQRWTKDECEALKRRDPITYETDVESNFADPISHMYAEKDLMRATRTGERDLPPDPLRTYVAAMDPAGSGGNAWTLVVSTNDGRKPVVALAREWIGEPADVVLEEIAELIAPYGLKRVRSDQWSADALIALARRYGLSIEVIQLGQREKFDAYDGLRLMLETTTPGIELIDNERLRDDLKKVQKKATPEGYRIVLPVTPDGRHCDFAPALVLTLARPIAAPKEAPPVVGSPEWFAAQEKAWQDQTIKELAKRRRREKPSEMIRRLASR